MRAYMTTTLKIPVDLREWVETQAQKEHRSMTGYIVAVLEREQERVEKRAERERVKVGA